MARLMEGEEPMTEKPDKSSGSSGRKPSFKNKNASGIDRRSYRLNRVTVPSEVVPELASKLNALVLEAEPSSSTSQAGFVKAKVRALENQLQKKKVVIVRQPSKTAGDVKDKNVVIVRQPSKAAGDVKEKSSAVVVARKPSRTAGDVKEKSTAVKPRVEPKPAPTKERKFSIQSRPNKVYKPEVPLPEKRLSLLKNQQDLESVFVKEAKAAKTEGKTVPNITANKSFLWTRTQRTNSPQQTLEKKEDEPTIIEQEKPQDPVERVEAFNKGYEEILASNELEQKTKLERALSNLSSATYEDIEQFQDQDTDYEDPENVYADINESIYDDIGEYELVGPAASECSFDQRNSLYGARPPSVASTNSNQGGNANSKSDTSEEWVDEIAEEVTEELIVITPQQNCQKKSSVKGGSWAKIRRKWASKKRAAAESDSDNDSTKYYEVINNHDDDSAVCDDFESDSDSSFDKGEDENSKTPEKSFQHETNIYSRVKDGVKSIGRKAVKNTLTKPWLRRLSRTFESEGGSFSRVRWRLSLKDAEAKKEKSRSKFYFNDESESALKKRDVRLVENPKTELNADQRRSNTAIRPSTLPPPPPPPNSQRLNGEKRQNNESMSSLDKLDDRKATIDDSWYSENGKNGTSISSDCSSHGSNLNLRFADEPLYQIYVDRVARMERKEYELGSEIDNYEEIKSNGSSKPSALDIASMGIQRSLWCQLPQVVSSGIVDTLSRAQVALQEAKFELITSEASYYKSLMVLEKHFVSCPSLKDESILPKQDYKIVFGNIAPVRKSSEAVLGALEKCWQESIMLEGICDIIYQVSQEYFKSFITYCTSLVSITNTLQRIRESNSAFVQILNSLESSPKCQSLPLSSFLLLPMQRITRMPLLMDAILTKMEPSHPEYESCRLALAHMDKIARESNEAAQRSERYEELIRISRQLIFPAGLRPLPLLSPSRWLVRSGPVSQLNLEAKQTFGRKTPTKKLILYLFTDYLIIAKKKGENNYSVVDYCVRNMVQMTEMDDAIGNRYLVLLILLENHEKKTQEMILCCDSESSRERWLQALATPCSNNPEEVLYAEWDCPQVVAAHEYKSSEPDELHLQQGDVVNVLRKLHDGWYYGERIRDGEKGWFPGNYTFEIASSHVKAKNLKLRHRLLTLSANFIQQQKIKQTAS